MASSSTHFCTLCEVDFDSTQAVSWCLECEVWHCTDCEKYHGRSTLSKQHKTITVADYETLPPSVLKIGNRCTQHNDRFERFCSFHGAPCCIQCISDTHKDCELSPLVEVLQNVKKSAAVSHLERDLNEIKEQLEVVERHLSDRIEKLYDEKKYCLNEIKRIRSSVNEHLDIIERNILDELSQKEKNIKETIELLANQIESKKRKVVNLHDSLLKTKQFATDLQIFLSINEMAKQTTDDTKYLEDLEEMDAIVDRSLQLEVSTALISLHTDVVAFGKVSVNSVSPTLILKRTNQEQAQLLPVVCSLDKVNIVKTLTIDLTKSMSQLITACDILPSGECVFVDYSDCSRLLLYDTHGSYRDDVKFSSRPYDMCYIKDNIVGISFPYEKKVHFVDVSKYKIVDVSKYKIVKTIEMEHMCYEIDCCAEKLFVRLPGENAVVIMDLDGKIQKRVHIPGNDVTSIASHKKYIFCTYWKESEIACYDLNGKMVWKHKYEGLVKPRSIAIDKKLDIIYVAGYYSNNLVAISINGDQSKIVLSKEDGLNQVCSVRANTDNKLLVCNESNGLAFLCQL